MYGALPWHLQPCYTAALPPTMIWLMGCKHRGSVRVLRRQHSLDDHVVSFDAHHASVQRRRRAAYNEDQFDKETDKSHDDEA